MTTCRLRSPRSRSSPHTSYSQGKRPGERAIRARSIAILGWYGDFNAGNEAILSGILLSLRGVMPHGDFAVFSWHPELTARQHRVRAFPYYKLFQVLPRVDALIVGGGTLLTDWQLALPLFSLLVLAVGWAKMLGKPVIFYAVGAEPFSTRLGRILARAIINRADLVTVRGYRSKRFLEMLGTAKPIHVTADPALVLQPPCPRRAENVLRREGIPEVEGLRVVVCLRHCRGVGQNVRFERAIAELCDHLAETFRAQVIFLPISTSVYDDDRRVAAETVEMMKNHGNIKLITGRLTPREAMAVIERSNLVVSMRLHPLIFATVTHTPLIALVGMLTPFVPPSNNKISEFLESVHQEDWICNYEDASVVDLLNKIRAAMVKSHVRNPSNPSLPRLRESCISNARLAEEAVGELSPIVFESK